MGLSDKSMNHKLYMCQTEGCRVVMFISPEDFCPFCTATGLLLRDRIAHDLLEDRDRIRRELSLKP
jgi:rRNA maturation endonuclease Nob1